MFDFGKMKSKSIVKGILLIGIIYVIIILLTSLSELILVSGTPGGSPLIAFNSNMYLVNTWLVPILGIALLKLLCESLYKILRLSEIIINKNTEK